VDLRPTLPPVRDQGPVGACAAFTGAAIKEGQERVDTNVNLRGYLSPWFIYNLRANKAP
jgi:hypothetical protein